MPPIGIARGSSILIGRNLVGGVQPDVSQPISPPALAPPPVQSRVCPGYRIERTELRAAGGADSGFARIKLSSHSRISIVGFRSGSHSWFDLRPADITSAARLGVESCKPRKAHPGDGT